MARTAARKEGPGLSAGFSASAFAASACIGGSASLGSDGFGSPAAEAIGPAIAASRAAARTKQNLKLLIKTSPARKDLRLSSTGPSTGFLTFRGREGGTRLANNWFTARLPALVANS